MAKRNSRSSRRSSRRQRGGQMNVNDTSMNVASRASLTNGENFLAAHRSQHGGEGAMREMNVSQHGGMAPVGDTGVLDDSLRSFARVGPLDEAMQQIQGMSDQAGGRRRASRKARKGRKASRKSRKASRKSRKSRKARKASRKGRKASRKARKQRGGYAPADAPGNLLPPDLEATALSGQNPEMKLAADPNFLAPKA